MVRVGVTRTFSSRARSGRFRTSMMVRLYSRCRRPCTTSRCNGPRNPQRKPKPRAVDVSGSYESAASFRRSARRSFVPRVNDGSLKHVVGNGPESLARITMVGNDFEIDESGWTCGKDGQSVPVSLGMPTVLVSGIVVGGSAA